MTDEPTEVKYTKADILKTAACSVIFVALVSIFILLTIARTRSPSISVAAASIPAFNVSESYISGVWDIDFSIHNSLPWPCTLTDIQISLYYKKSILSRTWIMSSHQGSRNRTTLRTTFTFTRDSVDQPTRNALNSDMAASGSVYFTIKFSGQLSYEVWWLRTPGVDLECKKISLDSKNGTLVGGPRRCISH